MGRRDDLLAAMARVQHGKAQVRDARAAMVKRANEQIDTMAQPIADVGDHVKVEQGGGVLAARRHRLLLDERRRLHRFVADHDK